MNKSYYRSEQARIAEECVFLDKHTAQTSRLALIKINSYKLSLIKTSFSTSKEDMTEIIKYTLLNYQDPAKVLAHTDFFDTEINN